MIRPATFLLVIISLLAACGPNTDHAEGTDSRADVVNATSTLPSADSININTASSEELQRIPHIGPSVAVQVIEYREEHGPFKRPEELMLVQGISDVRFRRIRHLIRVE